MNDEAWLAGLKAGDEVSVANERIEVVKRVTPTQIIVGRAERFNRKSGRSVGTSGWSHWLYPVSDVLRDRVARNAALSALRHTDTSKVPTATLQAMVKLMNTALAGEE